MVSMRQTLFAPRGPFQLGLSGVFAGVCLDGKLSRSEEDVMTPESDTLEAAALQSTSADRARLVDRLIAPLDADPKLEDAWAAEVAHRHSEIDNEVVSQLPGPKPLRS